MNLVGGEVIDDETWSFVREELQTGWNAQAALVAGRQARIAAANARLESAHIEGIGQHVASIDLMAWTDWERRHPGITGQKDWLDSLLRDNPECRVNSRSAKTQVSFAGLDFRPAEVTGVCPFPKAETGNLKAECNVAAPSPASAVSSTRHSSLVTSHAAEAASAA